METSHYIINGIQILRSRWSYERARFWFLPIVFGFTIFCGILNGIKGVIFGFAYGVIAGLFLIHESLLENKTE